MSDDLFLMNMDLKFSFWWWFILKKSFYVLHLKQSILKFPANGQFSLIQSQLLALIFHYILLHPCVAYVSSKWEGS